MKTRKRLVFAVLCLGLLFFLSSTVSGGMIGKWGDEWKKTKKKFEEITGKKKPSKKVLLIFRSAGIDKSLKKLDKEYKKSPRDVEAFKKALKNFIKKKDSYIKKLKKAIKKADAESTYANGLKMLKRDLKAIQATAESQVAILDSSKGGDRHEKTRELALKFLKSGLAKAKKFVSEVKTDPRSETWNAGITAAGRDITQYLKNISRYIDDGDDRWKGKNPQKIVDGLEPYAESRVTFKENVSRKAILNEIAKFEKLVKKVSKWVKLQK